MDTTDTAAGVTVTPARPIAALALVALGIAGALVEPARALLAPIGAFPALALAACCALGASVGPPGWRKTALALAAVIGGFGWAELRTSHPGAEFLGARLDPSTSTVVTLEGLITTPPQTGPDQRAGALARFAPPIEATRFRLLADTRIDARGVAERVTGSFHVRVEGITDAPRVGRRVRITGRALAIGPPRNPGEPDFRPVATQDRIAGTLLVPTGGLIEPARTAAPALHRPRAAFLHLRAGAQRFVREWIANASPRRDDARALLGALMLGERSGDADRLHSAFARVGLAHLLAISGLHLVAVAWGALLALRLVGDRPRLETAIVLIAVLAYCFVVPVRTPIVRAAIMTIAFLAAELSGRRYNPLAILSLTALAILVWRPTELTSVGFQLSFGVVGALIVCTPRIERRLFPFDPPPDERTARQAAALRLRRVVIAAVVAWAIATPVVAHRVGVISPLAPLLTVLLAPPVTLLLIGAFGALLLGAVAPALGAIASPALAWLAGLIAQIALIADALPLSVIHVPRVSALWALGATLVIGWWLTAGRRTHGVVIATLLAVAWTAVAFAPPRLPANTLLRIDALDVGDGSCLLVRSGGDALLIDAGADHFGAGLRTIPRALRALGAPRIDTAIITHPNIDHANALLDAAPQIGLRRLLVTDDFLDRASESREGWAPVFTQAALEMGIRFETIAAGDAIPLGSLAAEILSPPRPNPFDDVNDNSIVLRFTARTDTGARTLLTAGDIEHDAIERLFADHPTLRADIAEAPHHGSAVTGAGEFILRADPQVVIQSTGPSRLNDDRLDEARRGRTWLATAQHGAVWVAVRRDGAILTGGALPAPPRGPARAVSPAR